MILITIIMVIVNDDHDITNSDNNDNNEHDNTSSNNNNSCNNDNNNDHNEIIIDNNNDNDDDNNNNDNNKCGPQVVSLPSTCLLRILENGGKLQKTLETRSLYFEGGTFARGTSIFHKSSFLFQHESIVGGHLVKSP